MKSRIEKRWVVVRFRTGAVKAWRDYGQAWGSPLYEVICYHTGEKPLGPWTKGDTRKGQTP